jgi:hypothetical protein
MKDAQKRGDIKQGIREAGDDDKAQGEKDNFAYQLHFVFNKPEVEFIF